MNASPSIKNRQAVSAALKLRWQDPEYRKRMSAQAKVQTAARIARQQQPSMGALDALDQGRKTCWSNPAHREKMRKIASETMRKTNLRRSAGEFPAWTDNIIGCRSGHGTRYSRPNGRGGCMLCNRLKTYGLSPKEYDDLMSAQEGLCAICRLHPASHIDHDHTTGNVRGILCLRCNTGLGKLGDSVEILNSAVRYLKAVTA